MPYLRVRYRHEVKCKQPECGKLVVPEGRLSDVIHGDGELVKVEPGGDQDMRSAFVLAPCRP